MAFSYHVHLLAENISRLRLRVAEMREPPLGLDAVPELAYALFFDEYLPRLPSKRPWSVFIE